jgi:hypothetical protein
MSNLKPFLFAAALFVLVLTPIACKHDNPSIQIHKPKILYHGTFNDPGWIIAEITFRHKSFRFALDTGAQHTFFLKRHHTMFTDPIRVVNFIDINRQVEPAKAYQLTEDDDLKLGRISFQGPIICETKQRTDIAFRSVDGFLGSDFLKYFVLQLDFTNNEVTISDKVLPSKDNLGKAFAMIHMESNNYVPYLNFKICKEVEEPYMIDTGEINPGIRIDLETYNNWADPDAPKSREQFLSDPKNVNGAIKRNLDLDNEHVYRDVLISEALRNIITLTFLRRHDMVIFDYPNKVVYLKQR